MNKSISGADMYVYSIAFRGFMSSELKTVAEFLELAVKGAVMWRDDVFGCADRC